MRSLGLDSFVDIGSGGGFPGVPIAVALPARRAMLVDSVTRKARFLATATGAVEAALMDEAGGSARPRTSIGRIEVAPIRVEELAADRRGRERWAAVTARAVAQLAELAELALPLLIRGGRLIAWKRGDLEAELDRARRALDELGGAEIELHDVPVASLAGHRLVLVEKIGPTPARFPRDPAERRRRPW